jgi:hypothetical protein
VSIYRKTAALVSVITLLLGGATLASSSAAAASGTGVVDCAGTIVERPHEFVITCADAGVMIQKITWKSWTNARAIGKGTLVWNTCLPKTCVDGIVQTYKATIRLGRPASGPNAAVFTRITLTFPNGGPANLETGTYTIDRPIAS